MNQHCFTVTHVSGNVTTIARSAPDPIPCLEAARLLEIAPQALEQWSRKLAFPSVVGGESGISFRREEIEALRATLPASHSVEGAVREARRRLGLPG